MQHKNSFRINNNNNIEYSLNKNLCRHSPPTYNIDKWQCLLSITINKSIFGKPYCLIIGSKVDCNSVNLCTKNLLFSSFFIHGILVAELMDYISVNWFNHKLIGEQPIFTLVVVVFYALYSHHVKSQYVCHHILCKSSFVHIPWMEFVC